MKAPSAVTLVLASALAAGLAQAQGALAPTKEWSATPVFTMWTLGTALSQTAGDITGVSQVAIPIRARLRFANAWRVDLNGAFSQSTVTVDRAAGTTGNTLTLSGLSDINVRLTGPVAGGLHLTAGATLPTGKTELGADEMAALQVIASPALSMPVASMGLGFSGTVGLLGARQFGEWALALGASVEQRGEYTPVALALSSGESRTTLTPGTAMHASFGADRSIGNQRLSFLVVADIYGEDNLTTGVGSATSTSAYTLGPQVTALTRLDFSASGWRETMMSASFRQRSAYTDNLGASVEGSSASYLEASIGGVRGEIARRGIILGADARFQSGLDFTNALVGAAVTAAGATIGVDWPFAEANLRLAFRFQAGSLKSGDTSSSVTGLQFTGNLSARGGSR